MIFSAAIGTGTHPARRHASRGYYGTYLPPERMTATMFAPCLLGCHGTARQRPVPGGSGSRGLPHSPAGSSIIRHQEAFSNSCCSGLLIRGFGVRVPGGAPVLTWGFVAPGHFLCVRFVPMLAPCSLVSHDRVVAGLSKTAAIGPCRASRPPDQWSIPLASSSDRAQEACGVPVLLTAVDLRRLQPADVLMSHPRSLLLRASGITGRGHRRTIEGR
jgi:hypothetical protein